MYYEIVPMDRSHIPQILTLEQLRNAEADMFTTVFVGSSTTRVVEGRMVTPRGYLQREGKEG